MAGKFTGNVQRSEQMSGMDYNDNNNEDVLMQTNANPSTAEYIEGSQNVSGRNSKAQRSNFPVKKNSTLRLKENGLQSLPNGEHSNENGQKSSTNRKETDAYYRQLSSLYNVNVQVKNNEEGVGISEELEQFVNDNSMQ